MCDRIFVPVLRRLAQVYIRDRIVDIASHLRPMMVMGMRVMPFDWLGCWCLVAWLSARLAVVPFTVFMDVPSKDHRLFLFEGPSNCGRSYSNFDFHLMVMRCSSQ